VARNSHIWIQKLHNCYNYLCEQKCWNTWWCEAGFSGPIRAMVWGLLVPNSTIPFFTPWPQTWFCLTQPFRLHYMMRHQRCCFSAAAETSELWEQDTPKRKLEKIAWRNSRVRRLDSLQGDVITSHALLYISKLAHRRLLKHLVARWRYIKHFIHYSELIVLMAYGGPDYLAHIQRHCVAKHQWTPIFVRIIQWSFTHHHHINNIIFRFQSQGNVFVTSSPRTMFICLHLDMHPSSIQRHH
jgi:hypothetical protein